MIIDKDYYEILGIKRNTSIEELKKAFRKKVKQFHPDASRENTSEEFKKILEAYQTLLEYKQNNLIIEEDMDDIMDEDFGYFSDEDIENYVIDIYRKVLVIKLGNYAKKRAMEQ